MQIEVSENWMTAGTIIGMLVFGAVGTFAKLYMKSREDERTSAAASPLVAASAIGAAFVDRSAAQDIAAMREDVGALRKLAEDRKEHEDLKRLAQDAARDELLRRNPPPPKRRAVDD